jgi:hypothetical protein
LSGLGDARLCVPFDERIQKIKAIQRGWINNFRLANIPGKLNELD